MLSKVFAFDTKLYFITHSCNEYCATHVRGLHVSSEGSLLQAGTHCSHLLPASQYLIFVPLAFAFCHCNTVKAILLHAVCKCLFFCTTSTWRLELHGITGMGTVRLTENLGSVIRPISECLGHFAHFLNWSQHTSFYMNNNIYNDNLYTWLYVDNIIAENCLCFSFFLSLHLNLLVRWQRKIYAHNINFLILLITFSLTTVLIKSILNSSF